MQLRFRPPVSPVVSESLGTGEARVNNALGLFEGCDGIYPCDCGAVDIQLIINATLGLW